MRYHTKLDGSYGECQADQGGCPFAKDGALHFDTKSEAIKQSEKTLSEQYGQTRSMKKNTISDSTRETIEMFLDESEKFINAEKNGKKLSEFIGSFREVERKEHYTNYTFDPNFVKEVDADHYDIEQIYEAFVEYEKGRSSAVLDYEVDLKKGKLFITYDMNNDYFMEDKLSL